MILTNSQTPPVGFTYTGIDVKAFNGGTWTMMAAIPTPREALAAAAMNGVVYAVGGYSNSALAVNEAYDPTTNSWIVRAPMPTPRYLLAAVAVNGVVYAVGGLGHGSPLAVNEAYYPSADTWSVKTLMPTPRDSLAAAAVNGRIYAIGGRVSLSPTSLSRADNEAYDPATNSWSVKAPMPTRRFGLAAVSVNSRVYAIGGATKGGANGLSLAANEAYDPATDSWSVKAPLQVPRHYLAAAATNGRIYAVGGLFYSSELAGTEAYDPAYDVWSAVNVMPTSRVLLAAAAVNGRVYAVGGSGNYSLLASTVAFNPGVTLYVHQKN